jgi:predicted dithiol-disulfide oxidoreductase (DUF899 family)
MTYAETKSALSAKRQEMEALRKEMRTLQAAVEPQAVQDYELTGWSGPLKLSQMFGGKDDLIVIHNMGTGCPSCTMWADGFNGVYQHLASRAAFFVTSPNTVAVQQAFAGGRGWRFPMASHAGTTFAQDLGYRRLGADAGGDALGGWWPGVSVFKKDGESVLRVSDTDLGPFDGFCAVYSLLDLTPEGADHWEPKFRYA